MGGCSDSGRSHTLGGPPQPVQPTRPIDPQDLPSEPPELHRTNSRHEGILMWLSEKLLEMLGESDVEALVAGAEMILADENTPLDEAAELVIQMLESENVPDDIVKGFTEKAARLS